MGEAITVVTVLVALAALLVEWAWRYIHRESFWGIFVRAWKETRPTRTKLQTPQNLDYTVDAGGITWTWDVVPDALGYKVEIQENISPGALPEWVLFTIRETPAPKARLDYFLDGLTPDTEYRVRVRAVPEMLS